MFLHMAVGKESDQIVEGIISLVRPPDYGVNLQVF